MHGKAAEEYPFMNETGQEKNVGRSVWAVFAGFLVVVVLSIATDAVLHAAGIFPALGQRMSDGLFVLATIYRTIYAVVGSYITARLAPNKPMKHALIGGAITWNKDLGPHWYPIALAVEALPTAWVGARLRLMGTSNE